MTKETMFKILRGDREALRSYCQEKGLSYHVLSYTIAQNIEYLASIWGINTIHDKNGKFVGVFK
jgi:hypothetical protein